MTVAIVVYKGSKLVVYRMLTSFHSVFADEVKVENSKVKSLLLANDEKTIVSHFSLYNEDDIIKKYPLCRSDTPILYHSYTDFSVYTPHIIKKFYRR